jgi:hypothetical protein
LRKKVLGKMIKLSVEMLEIAMINGGPQSQKPKTFLGASFVFSVGNGKSGPGKLPGLTPLKKELENLYWSENREIIEIGINRRNNDRKS